MKIESRKNGVTKSPPPRRRDRMLRAICCCKNRQDDNENDQYILSYDEPDLFNDYISKEQGRNDRFSINFPRHCVLGHLLLDTNPLNDEDLWKGVVQPTKKPRSSDPRKSKPIQTTKKTTNKKNTTED